MRIIDREWREAADLRPSRIALAFTLIAATLLRIWALGQGIPYRPRLGEPELLDRALFIIKKGDFNPHLFDQPSLYVYVQAAIAAARFLFGAVRGEWSSLAAAPAADFYLWARAVGAIIGVATVWILYLGGLRWGARTALLAAGLLTVMPMHVRESHYAIADVPATLLITLAFVLSLRAHERATPGTFALAGAVVGLAGATKYSAAVAVVMPLAACWMTPAARPSRLVISLAILGATLVAFLAAAPYTVLDLPSFLNAFARLAAAYRAGPPGIDAPALVSARYLKDAWHWPATLIVAGGLVLGCVRTVKGPGRVKWTLVTLFPIVYLSLLWRHPVVGGRHLLPVLPFLSLLGAAAVVSGVSHLRRYEIPRSARKVLIAALVLIAVVPPAYSAVMFDVGLARASTLRQAYDWIARQGPAGSPVLVAGPNLPLPPASSGQ